MNGAKTMKAVMNSVISVGLVFLLAAGEMPKIGPVTDKKPLEAVQVHDLPISNGTACVCAPPIYVVMTSMS